MSNGTTIHLNRSNFLATAVAFSLLTQEEWKGELGLTVGIGVIQDINIGEIVLNAEGGELSAKDFAFKLSSGMTIYLQLAQHPAVNGWLLYRAWLLNEQGYVGQIDLTGSEELFNELKQMSSVR